ncbi:conserved phage C-terminal domain-containing protein [Paralcaligenes ginsengisoli]
MARSRNIKPGFFTNDELVELPFEYRLLFIGLWTIADRDGRLVDRPKKIKMEIFPADNVDCEKGISMLASAGFITRYSVHEQQFIQIKTWVKHQNPHIKEAKSTIPAPGLHGASTIQEPCEAQPLPEQAGLIPDSLNLIPDSLKTTLSGNPDESLNTQAKEVLEYLNTKSGRNYRMVEANMDLVVARLKAGATVSDCKAVIDAKTTQWASDKKMQEYLRPTTLFNRTKFEQYLGQLGGGGSVSGTEWESAI